MSFLIRVSTAAFLAGLFVAAPSSAFAAPPLGVHEASPNANVRTFSQPAVQNGKVTFETQGIRLNGSAPAHGGQPQQITLEVPESHKGMRLAHIELEHSQNLGEKTRPWDGSKNHPDETAPYSQVEVYVAGQGWTNLGQRKKFAEGRMEVERLHDLPAASGDVTAVRVRNVGVDPVHVQRVVLHFLPTKPAQFDEMIFTPGASFGDPWASVAPHIDRNRTPNVDGTRYTNGITLNNRGEWAQTPQATLDRLKARGWTLEPDALVIPLEPGKRIRTAEIAIGDTHPDPNPNSDGSFGRKGFAKLNMTLERADGTSVELTRSENVPAQGVMVGSADHLVQSGDRLRIGVGADTASLMGVRLGYEAR